MDGGFRLYLADRDFDVMHLEQMRDVIKRSRELLASTPPPSTFVGRKTHEPFRKEEADPMERPDIQELMESEDLQPPKGK